MMAYFDVGHEPRFDPPEYEVPICPVCHDECAEYYLSINREIIGCECCFDDTEEYEQKVDAWEWDEQNRPWGIGL